MRPVDADKLVDRFKPKKRNMADWYLGETVVAIIEKEPTVELNKENKKKDE